MVSRIRRRSALAVSLVLAGAAWAARSGQGPERGTERGDVQPAGYEIVYYDGEGERGELTGGAVLRPLGPDPATLDVRPAAVTTLFQGGAPFAPEAARGTVDNRVDLVFVGDGYTAADLPTYHAHVDTVVAGLFGTEPLGRYSELIAVHRVDVVSNESGVDNDPSQGIDRDTALNMSYWCNGIERLLCVSTGLASQYAQNAPGVDQIIALANSTKYGGAGYLSSNLATSSGGNGSALEIVKHELGHSLGNLADEYTYGGPTNYTGGEPTGRNVSTYSAATMASLGAKWANWLGASAAGFEGTVGTFEGAQYSETGIYRPTNNSLMRSLGRPFNLVGAEQVIKQLYVEVSPIDASSDPNLTYADTDVLFVDAVVVGGAPLPVVWELDGAVVHTGATLDLSTLSLPGCGASSTITATVRDGTPWVRDEAFRDARMTETLQFEVGTPWAVPGCPPVANSAFAIGSSMGVLGSPSIAAEDLQLQAYSGPPFAPVLFFYGEDAAPVVFGQGTICVGGTIQRLAIAFFDPLGFATHTVDWQADPVVLPGTALTPGSTWTFQGWYRDLDPIGAQSFNFTSSVRVTFCP